METLTLGTTEDKKPGRFVPDQINDELHEIHVLPNLNLSSSEIQQISPDLTSSEKLRKKS